MAEMTHFSYPKLMPHVATAAPTILVFDSGLGGLTVYREIARQRPDARFIYVADDAFFPYGDMAQDRLIDRVVNVMNDLIAAHRPDLIVVACNTASTLVLPHLRARHAVPFVGAVPAIKPACAGSATKLISVLGTESTVSREYTKKLIQDFAAACDVTLVGSRKLAPFAEAELAGEPVDAAEIAVEIAPCFVERQGKRTDSVVLACTHYPLLLDRFERLAPWPVRWIDPAPAVARRVVDLLGRATSGSPGPAVRFIFTSGRVPSPVLAKAIARFDPSAALRTREFDSPAVSA